MLINGNKVEDNIPEDQSLVIKTSKGLALVSGCGHAGIVNTLEHASKLFNNTSNIYAAVGGFHLFNKTDIYFASETTTPLSKGRTPETKKMCALQGLRINFNAKYKSTKTQNAHYQNAP